VDLTDSYDDFSDDLKISGVRYSGCASGFIWSRKADLAQFSTLQ